MTAGALAVADPVATGGVTNAAIPVTVGAIAAAVAVAPGTETIALIDGANAEPLAVDTGTGAIA